MLGNFMRKKIYLPSYWIIDYNQAYSHSFGIRLKICFMNGIIATYATYKYFRSCNRLEAAENESF